MSSAIMGHLLLLGFLFFVVKAWFDAGDEIREHDREMEQIKRRTAAGCETISH